MCAWQLFSGTCGCAIFESINETVIVDYSGSMKMMYYHAQDTAELATQENSVEALRELIDQENGKIENEDNALKLS